MKITVNTPAYTSLIIQYYVFTSSVFFKKWHNFLNVEYLKERQTNPEYRVECNNSMSINERH